MSIQGLHTEHCTGRHVSQKVNIIWYCAWQRSPYQGWLEWKLLITYGCAVTRAVGIFPLGFIFIVCAFQHFGILEKLSGYLYISWGSPHFLKGSKYSWRMYSVSTYRLCLFSSLGEPSHIASFWSSHLPGIVIQLLAIVWVYSLCIDAHWWQSIEWLSWFEIPFVKIINTSTARSQD